VAQRVVVSSYTFLPDIGGVATNKYTLCRALVEEGYDVSVVTNTPGPTQGEGYRIYRNPNPLKLFWLYWKADIVYLSNLSLKLGWPVALLNRKYGLCHHSLSAFEGRSNGLKGKLKNWLSDIIIRKSVHFPNSLFTLAVGQEILAGKHCAVAYPISLKTQAELTTRAEYQQRKDVFFAGRLVEEKGAGFLIDHWPEIQEHLGVKTLHIAGEGPAMKELKARVKERKLTGVDFLGKQTLDQVIEGMKRAAYVMTPSVWAEPFGNVGVEGVTSGAVVISSDRGGLPEAVGDLGVLFSFEDKGSFVKALDKAKKLRDKILASDRAFDEHRERVNKHLSQFSGSTIVGVIRAHLG